MIGRTLMCLLAILTCSGIAAAQDLRTYVGGAFGSSSSGPHHVSGGSPSTSFDNTSINSMAGGVSAEAGWFFSRSSSVGIEVIIPFHRINIAQEYGYIFGPYRREAHYCEQAILGVVRGEVQTGRRLVVGVVAGGGLVRGSSLDRVSVLDTRSNTYGPLSDETETTGLTMGVMGGADLAIQTSRHVSVVPQFRMLVIPRGDPKNGRGFFADLGLPTLVYRIGVGVRAAF